MNTTLPPLEQALAIFAHELREPLASILFAVQVIEKTEGAESSAHELCEIVDRQGHYLARMVDDILEVCQASQHKTLLHKQWFDLGTVLENAIETATPLLRKKGHRLSVCRPPTRIDLLADSVRVQQIAVNLLVNAAKYTEPGGVIELMAETSGDWLSIKVRDNGIGIPAALLPRIFNLFQQGEADERRGAAGLGIGLALVKSLVELHGGTISAHSDGVGTGSTFIVRLPVSGAPAHMGGFEVRFYAHPPAQHDFMGDA